MVVDVVRQRFVGGVSQNLFEIDKIERHDYIII